MERCIPKAVRIRLRAMHHGAGAEGAAVAA
jgi:hypothetical protein